MADYLIKGETLTGIADAIRRKTGSTEDIKAKDMEFTIDSISTGTDTSDATASANDILSGKTAYVNGNKVTGNIPSKSATAYTPTTINQIITSGTYLAGTQTIKGDANLKAENIASGVSIFGINGTHSGGEDIDTELTEQETLISQLSTILDSKASGGGDNASSTFIQVTIDQTAGHNFYYIDDSYSLARAGSGQTVNALNGIILFNVAGISSSATGDYVASSDGSLYLYKFNSNGGTVDSEMGGAGGAP